MTLKNRININFNFNSKIQLDFNGGNISSDTGLLLYREFAHKINLHSIISNHLTFTRPYRKHAGIDCCLQKIYSFISGYEDNNDAAILTHDPIMQEVNNKQTLASQPTLCRFENSLTQKML